MEWLFCVCVCVCFSMYVHCVHASYVNNMKTICWMRTRACSLHQNASECEIGHFLLRLWMWLTNSIYLHRSMCVLRVCVFVLLFSFLFFHYIIYWNRDVHILILCHCSHVGYSSYRWCVCVCWSFPRHTLFALTLSCTAQFFFSPALNMHMDQFNLFKLIMCAMLNLKRQQQSRTTPITNKSPLFIVILIYNARVANCMPNCDDQCSWQWILWINRFSLSEFPFVMMMIMISFLSLLQVS